VARRRSGRRQTRVHLHPEHHRGHGHSDLLDRHQTQTLETLSTITGTAVGIGVSALLYVTKPDGLGLYVSPRYTYSHLSTTSSASRAASTTTSTHGVSGSLGAQYAMGRRFGVFGEVGLMYTRGLIETPQIEGGPNSPLPTSQSASRNRSVGLRSGVGVVLYVR
jgi:hypothetical protein